MNNEKYNISIDELELSTRAYRALCRAGLKTVGEILKFGDLKRIRNLGETTLIEIVSKLREYNVDSDDLIRITGGKSIPKYLGEEFDIEEFSSPLGTRYGTPIEDISIDGLELSERAYKCLKGAGINTIGDIIKFGDLSKIDRMGKKSIKEVAYEVKEYIAESEYIEAKRSRENASKTESSSNTPRYGMPLDELELTMRTINALRKNGIENVKDILKFGNLKRIRNLGRDSYDEIAKRLYENGFYLIDDTLSLLESEKDYSKYDLSIDDLGLSSRTHVALRNAGIKTLGDILLYQDSGYLSEIYRIGKKALKELETLIKKLGIRSDDKPAVKDDSIEILRTEVEEKEEKSKLLDEAIELAKQHSKLKETESKLDKEIKRKEELLKGFGFIYEKE